MNDMMLTVLTLSASGSVLALALLALRPLVKNRVSKAFQYYIWLLVLLRLAVPLSFEGSAMNQLVSAAPAAGTPAVVTVPGDGGGAAAAQENAPPDDGVNTAPRETRPPRPGRRPPPPAGKRPPPGRPRRRLISYRRSRNTRFSYGWRARRCISSGSWLPICVLPAPSARPASRPTRRTRRCLRGSGAAPGRASPATPT